MAIKLCLDCGMRKPMSGDLELCEKCETYAGWENTHSDNGHEGNEDGTAEFTTNCPVCHPELDDRPTTRRTGHTNTVAKTRTSHAGHHHARDPQDRAICRKSMNTTGNPYDARKL